MWRSAEPIFFSAAIFSFPLWRKWNWTVHFNITASQHCFWSWCKMWKVWLPLQFSHDLPAHAVCWEKNVIYWRFASNHLQILWADTINYNRKLSLIKQSLCVSGMSFLMCFIAYKFSAGEWTVHTVLVLVAFLLQEKKKKEKSTHNVYGDTASFIFSTLIIFMWHLISQLSAPHRWRDYLQSSVWPGSTSAAILISIWSAVTLPACQLVQFSNQ